MCAALACPSLRGAQRRSNPAVVCGPLDCFAEPVIGRRFAPTRWLAMTVVAGAEPHHRRRRGNWLTIAGVNAGGLAQPWLHWPCEAASRVRSHISPGPYRSFRELSLARSVDLVTWCPPTFVGNSGIERSNGHRGFALLFCLFAAEFVHAATAVIPRESGVTSTPSFAVRSQLLWNTGSPAFAGDDSEGG
jgi:hypothetical protein